MTRTSRYRLVVFDWDGTLIDSTTAIAECIRAAARDLALPVPSFEQASHVIGLGLRDSLRLAVPALAPARTAAFVEAYRRHFLAAEARMPLFAGIRELLEGLRSRGYALAVATGKSRLGLDRALAANGLGPLFAASRCADETQPKPDPAMLHELMALLEVEPRDALMVGDTSHDLGMAQGAGVDALAVTYGAHPGDALRALGPRGCVDSVEALGAWIGQNG